MKKIVEIFADHCLLLFLILANKGLDTALKKKKGALKSGTFHIMSFLHRDHTYLHALLFYMWPVPLGFHLQGLMAFKAEALWVRVEDSEKFCVIDEHTSTKNG